MDTSSQDLTHRSLTDRFPDSLNKDKYNKQLLGHPAANAREQYYVLRAQPVFRSESKSRYHSMIDY